MAKKTQDMDMRNTDERGMEGSRTMAGGSPGQSRSEGGESFGSQGGRMNQGGSQGMESERGLTRGRGFRNQMSSRQGGQDWLSLMDRPLLNMRRLFDSFFDDMLSPFSMGVGMPRLGGRGMETGLSRLMPEMNFPRVDVTEDERNLIITAEMPGIDEKDIDVSLDEDRLIIRGEKRDESEDRGRDYYYRERSFGSFERVIPLPENVRPDACQADFRNGVLEIQLPKAEEGSRRRKIQIGQGRQGGAQQSGGRQEDAFRFGSQGGERGKERQEERGGERQREREKAGV